ncbi:hypothetical protein [Deinococcus hopiensis]|uniref:Uncharacterized protein n=1 Tax=Deinococcus hopiensis KR-140 TaxID=695939 RepID=A0A1W1VBN3_9DEIO|nr:hypothetical protein [Deinococcus hopiensis]SMB90600.1 hypothetical protein SAMN00790413_00827 [Deinococcus hopiensis KR-140]
MSGKNLARTVPPLLLVTATALFGVVAQIGVTLALARRRQFLDFILLSLVFSGGSTVLLSELARKKPTVVATIGAMLGAVRPLSTLRVDLKAVAGKYGSEINPAELEALRAKAEAKTQELGTLWQQPVIGSLVPLTWILPGGRCPRCCGAARRT